MNRERQSVAGYFAILGFVCAAWMSSIDDLKVLLGLDASEFGWILVAGPCGNFIGLAFAGPLFARLGSRKGLVAVASAYLFAGFGLAFCFLLRATLPVWCLAIAFWGGCGNLLNIAVNTQGGLVERKLGSPVMNSFHGVFSVMCFVSGVLALGAAALSIPVGVRIIGTLVLATFAHLMIFRSLPVDEQTEPEKGKTWHRPDRALVMLGFAAFVIMGCEATVCDWVGVYYRESLGAPESRVKWGFCAVMAAMTVGRFVSDRLVGCFGPSRILHVYSVFVSAGLVLALASPCLGLGRLAIQCLSTAGFAIVGFGLSALVPILYSRGGRTKSMPAASAITFLASMGFLGYFLWPPLIGHVAGTLSLSAALGIFAVLILGCLFVDPA